MKKYLAAAAALIAGTLAAAPALADHGQEYNLSACGTDGDTAHIVVITEGMYGEDAEIQTKLQETFTALMKEQSAADHRDITPAYVNGLVSVFGTAAAALADKSPTGLLYLDFTHPATAPALTPGCAP